MNGACGWKWRMIIAVNFQFKQLERRSLKKSRLQRNWNPWPPRYRCDALPTELWSHILGARSIYWVHISREEWNDVNFIWNNSYLNCGCGRKCRMIIAVNFQFKQLERKSLKNSRLQRDWNPWPPQYRCDALPTELWSHTSGARSNYWGLVSREKWNDVWLHSSVGRASHRYRAGHGFESRWSPDFLGFFFPIA